jgi:membrane associated rhomboid family serine protease
LIPLKDNNPTARFPILTVLLIAVNVAVFVWQISQPSEPGSSTSPKVAGLSQQDETTLEYGAVPYRLTHPGKGCGISASRVVCDGQMGYAGSQKLDEPPWWATIFTSMFMHGGILHIAFNMLFLWIFGNNIEDSMGRPRYLFFYLLAGIAAAYAQALLDANSTVPAVGASGAIAGVLGGYLLLFPRARVLTLVIVIFFVTLIEIPAVILLGAWFVLQFLPAIGQVGTDAVSGGGGVAYWAHVGGFAFGLAAIKLFANRYRGPTHA